MSGPAQFSDFWPGRLVRHLVCLATFGAAISSVAQEAISPPIADPLTVPQNWVRLDNPELHDYWSQAVAPDGTLWLAESRGVVHYDGTQWTHYGVEAGFDGGPVRAVLATDEGQVYAMTASTLYRLAKNRWEPLASVSLNWEAMNPLYEASNRSLFVGDEKGFLEIARDGVVRRSETGEGMVGFCEDDQGYLWMVTGVSRTVYRALLTPEGLAPRRKWERMLAPAAAPIQFSVLRRSGDGRIWLATMKHNDPLRYYDFATRTWTEIDLTPYLGSNLTTCAALRSDGGLWVVGEGALASVESADRVRVYRYPEVPIPQSRLFVEEAHDGYLWITERGTRAYRVDRLGRRWSQVAGLHFQVSAYGERWYVAENHTIVSEGNGEQRWRSHAKVDGMIDGVVALHRAHDGSLFAIGSHQRRAAFAHFDGARWERSVFPAFATGFSPEAFCETADGAILLGSGQHWDWHPTLQGGYLRLERKEGAWHSERIAPEAVPYRVQSIVETADGTRFLATGRGLLREVAGKATKVGALPFVRGTWIQSLATDSDDRIWGSLWGRGILAGKGGHWRTFTTNDGLGSNFVICVSAQPGYPVLALTERGLQRFDGRRWSAFARVGTDHHLPRRSGTIRWERGGALWVNLAHQYWFTNLIQDNGYDSSMRPAFESWRYRPDTSPPESRIRTVTAEDPSDRRSLQVAFEGSDEWSLTPAEELEFSYRIDGGAWSPFTKEHSLSLFSLNSGPHRLEARARDHDLNVDPTPASLAFVVDLPFWEEGWFLPVTLISLLALSGFAVLVVWQRARHTVLLEEQKLALFTNLSHELRTPLLLISAPLERLAAFDLSKAARTYVAEATRSVARLTEMIDQLLEFRRFQSGKMPIRNQSVELVGFCQNLLFSFEILAEEKQQKLSFSSSFTQVVTCLDADKLEIILTNLVSNAIKYSPEGASVRVSLDRFAREGGEWLRLGVEDSGPGISAAARRRLFAPFSRGPKEGIDGITGSGLGLAFTKEVLDRLGGYIVVESPLAPGTVHPGTRIVVELPIDSEASASGPFDASERYELTIAGDGEASPAHPLNGAKHTARLLLAEDHAEVRRYLRRELSDAFEIIEAEDGLSAWRAIDEFKPDIVLADLQMPGVNGVELCQRMRGEPAYAQTPIVLLTASHSESEELQALEAGADAFLHKPFKIALLRRRLANLLANRRPTNGGPVEMADEDSRLLRQVEGIVEERFADFLFDVEELCRRAGMSRSAFYRRMRAITDDSPSRMIRNRRLAEAAKSLRETRATVGEIFEKAGFIDKRTFNKAFKEHFACTPLEYRRRHRQAAR